MSPVRRHGKRFPVAAVLLCVLACGGGGGPMPDGFLLLGGVDATASSPFDGCRRWLLASTAVKKRKRPAQQKGVRAKPKAKEHPLVTSIRHQTEPHPGTTPIGRTARDFAHVLFGEPGHAEIDLERLLDACRKYERTMAEDLGQKQSARDLANNRRKVEDVLRQKSPELFRNDNKKVESSRQQQEHDGHPHHLHRHETLSSILHYEKKLGVHKPGSAKKKKGGDGDDASQAVLKDPSAAIGLLWMRRSFAFQCEWYRQLLDRPDRDPQQSAMIAYRKELQPYHRVVLQKLFAAGIRSQTPHRRETIFARLGGLQQQNDQRQHHDSDVEEEEEEEESDGTTGQDESLTAAVEKDLRELVGVWKPLVTRWQEIFVKHGMDDRRRV